MDPNESIQVESLFSIQGKTALITGGSRGIGLMIARGFLESGAKVYISSRKKEVCDRVAAELSKIGPCISVPSDVSTLDGCRSLAGEIAAREPRLHILVNNAGAVWFAPMAEYTESGWDKVIDTNIKSTFFLTRELMPLLEKT